MQAIYLDHLNWLESWLRLNGIEKRQPKTAR